jgi:branched-chain amino acid transport system permease protein
MELLGQQVVAGLATGAIYACMALALVMIYQAIDHLNFAQGEMAMFSTFIAWQLLAWGTPYWLAFVLTIALSFVGGLLIERIVFKRIENAPVLSHVVVFIALFAIFNSLAGFIWNFEIKPFPSPFGSGALFGGIVIERVLFKPLKDAPVLSHIVVFIALYAVINSVAGFIWEFTIKPFPSPFGTAPFLGSRLISNHQAGMIGITLLMLSALWAFFRFTRIGLAMRAAAASPESARLVGVRVGWMIALGWGMASAIGAVAGMLIAPVVFLEPNMMLSILLYGFAGAVLGGLTSPAGAVLGGFLVGVVENLAGTYIPVIGGELKLPIALFLIVAVLVVRPGGLLGRVAVQRV